ncbi:MAG: TRAM domain-containing protein [Clostridiales bacterium]|nr:TRAM domain-containing protein [Clostridiales bacterium]
MLVAKTDANKPVVFEKYEGWKMGDYIKIRIVETHTWYLVGEKIS